MLIRYKKSSNTTCIGEINEKIAQLYEARYEYEEAITYYTIAAEFYKETDSINDYARCINYRGIVKENSLHYLEAVNNYYFSLFEFTKNRKPHWYGECLFEHWIV